MIGRFGCPAPFVTVGFVTFVRLGDFALRLIAFVCLRDVLCRL